MGFRFQKRISIPFGRVNFSKSGVSLTEGVPGASHHHRAHAAHYARHLR
jgi:Protein of unknown function (DUF4236)